MKPFLFRFAEKCISPNRGERNNEYEYSNERNLVIWLGSPNRPAAIDESGAVGPMTKKCDMEKGEDNKDRRMWQ
jgi:hypothetical protein